MMTRHSTMLVGPTGGGKTVVINTLIKAQTYMGLPTKCITLNPKVLSTAGKDFLKSLSHKFSLKGRTVH
ncbi:hypothetical protein GQX74_011225 [Glossina fuscipes]|nr:hypothetical protein GQX74_011225 [Glossina fuscipes]